MKQLKMTTLLIGLLIIIAMFIVALWGATAVQENNKATKDRIEGIRMDSEKRKISIQSWGIGTTWGGYSLVIADWGASK
jgi:FtsZ-interacting cell division protein ZipA